MIAENTMEELRQRFPRLAQVSLTGSDDDEYRLEDTPAGAVESLYFYERSDFENAVTALVYKLKPEPIPDSMGAVFVNGLLDHKDMQKKAFVILSRGGYSGISCEQLKESCMKHGRASLGMNASGVTMDCGCTVQDISKEKWEEISLVIRKNHELTHFVQRKLFPENKNALRDEIKADMVGIIEALGTYDGFLARLFLGIEDSTYRNGGRLENYVLHDVSDDDLCLENAINDACRKAEEYISLMENKYGNDCKKGSAFDILIDIETSERDEYSQLSQESNTRD